MISLRRSGERGVTRLDWLDSKHSFSFGDYYDPGHMNLPIFKSMTSRHFVLEVQELQHVRTDTVGQFRHAAAILRRSVDPVVAGSSPVALA